MENFIDLSRHIVRAIHPWLGPKETPIHRSARGVNDSPRDKSLHHTGLAVDTKTVLRVNFFVEDHTIVHSECL
jgi:hypothetical protein